ncbi:MAG: hypothetical protein K2K57_06570, partial [Oscillospiraceae bacterium]|nr:hypothetical protein [Oscillospiraceae bacterium]
MRRAFHKLAAMAVMLTILTVTASGCGINTADNSENLPQNGAVNKEILSENIHVPYTSDIFSESLSETSPSLPILRNGDYLTCNFYDPTAFRMFDETASAYELTGTLRAGVVT